MTTLLTGRMSTCFFPRFSALYMDFSASFSTEMRTILATLRRRERKAGAAKRASAEPAEVGPPAKTLKRERSRGFARGGRVCEDQGASRTPQLNSRKMLTRRSSAAASFPSSVERLASPWRWRAERHERGARQAVAARPGGGAGGGERAHRVGARGRAKAVGAARRGLHPTCVPRLLRLAPGGRGAALRAWRDAGARGVASGAARNGAL
jgi:hypothetical protein